MQLCRPLSLNGVLGVKVGLCAAVFYGFPYKLHPKLKIAGMSLGKGLGMSLGKGLGMSLGKGLGMSLGKGLGMSLGKGLGMRLGKGLGMRLGNVQFYQCEVGFKVVVRALCLK